MLFCAKEYIRTTHSNGSQLLDLIESETHFVLSHPNGWEGREQAQMRRAAVLAGLVPDTPSGYERITLVTEGEASLHFSIQDGTLADTLEVRYSRFLLVTVAQPVFIRGAMELL